MKALTVQQPYAFAIAMKYKRWETRTQRTLYRGMVAIHAGKKQSRQLRKVFTDLQAQFPNEFGAYEYDELDYGCVIAVSSIVSTSATEPLRGVLSPMELALGNYSDGRFGWMLGRINRFPQPISAQGQLGLWEWKPEEEKA